MTEIKLPSNLEAELQSAALQIKSDPSKAQIVFDQLRMTHPNILFWDLQGNPTIPGAIGSEDASVAANFEKSKQLSVAEGNIPSSGQVDFQVVQPQIVELTGKHEVLSPMKIRVLAEIKPEDLVEVTIDDNPFFISKN